MIRKINRRSRAVSAIALPRRAAFLRGRHAQQQPKKKSSSAASSERMFRHVYRQANDGAASEVDDVVDRDHLQVQHHLPGTCDWPGEDQRGADVAGLLCSGKKTKKKKKEGKKREEDKKKNVRNEV